MALSSWWCRSPRSISYPMSRSEGSSAPPFCKPRNVSILFLLACGIYHYIQQPSIILDSTTTATVSSKQTAVAETTTTFSNNQVEESTKAHGHDNTISSARNISNTIIGATPKVNVVENHGSNLTTVSTTRSRAEKGNHKNSTPSSVWPDPKVVNQVIDKDDDDDKTVIVMIVSCPYLNFVDNAITSMLRVGIQNFVVVPLDDISHDTIQRLWPGHAITVPNFIPTNIPKRAAKFNSREFQQLTSTRPKILSAFLSLGYTVFYADSDAYWQSNQVVPTFAKLAGESNTSVDIVAMVDAPPIQDGKLCSCFMYILPTDASIQFLDYWQSIIDTKQHKNDQVALVHAYNRRTQDDHHAKFSLLPHDNPYVPNGRVFFDVLTSEQQRHVLLVHNNFVVGAQAKRSRFRDHDMWHPSQPPGDLEGLC